MITYAIMGAKTALLGLKNTGGVAIFAAAADIYTGFPNPDMVAQAPPTTSKPIVAIHFHGDVVHGLGYRQFFERAATGGAGHTQDRFAEADVTMKADIYVLAAEMMELVGRDSDKWAGYVEQILLLVRSHPLIVGPAVTGFTEDTVIKWDVMTFDIPGTVLDAQERRLSLAVINTTLEGPLMSAPVDGAKVLLLKPHDGKFTPVP